MANLVLVEWTADISVDIYVFNGGYQHIYTWENIRKTKTCEKEKQHHVKGRVPNLQNRLVLLLMHNHKSSVPARKV